MESSNPASSAAFPPAAMVLLSTESTHELDVVMNKICAVKGVVDTFSTILLSTKLERPE